MDTHILTVEVAVGPLIFAVLALFAAFSLAAGRKQEESK